MKRLFKEEGMFASSPAGRLGQTKDEREKRNPPTNWNGNARNVQCQTTQWHREIQYAISNKYNTVTERNTMFNVKQIQHREIQCSMSNKYNTVTEKNTICNAKQMQYGLNEMKTNLFIQKSEKQSLLSWYWYETRTDDNLDHNQWQAILKLICTISTAAEFLLSVHKIHDQGS